MLDAAKRRKRMFVQSDPRSVAYQYPIAYNEKVEKIEVKKQEN